MNELRWGLIGCGDISRKRVAPLLSKLSTSKLVSVSRSHFELAEQFAKEFGAKKWFKNWKDLIEDDEINAVYIATPVNMHSVQAIFAAQHGKHVLCEKPMAMNVKECKKMIKAADRNNIKLGISYYRRFYPSIERVKEIINDNEIGKPVLADIKTFEWFDRKPGEDRSWLLDRKVSGGGPLKDFGCHRIEILLNIFGNIKKLNSLTRTVHFKREVEDTSITQFEFESGTMALLNVTHATSESADSIDIYGTKGSIHIPVLNDGKVHIITKESKRVEDLPPPANFHEFLVKDFIDAVINDRKPVVDGNVGIAVEEIIERIYG